MRYSIEPRDKIYLKGYGFLSFAKSMGTHATKVTKNVSNKYSQKLIDSAKKFTADPIKTASKRAIQKTAEVNSNLIGNKVADKITTVSKELHSKKSLKESHSQNTLDKANNEIPPERYTSREKRRQVNG